MDFLLVYSSGSEEAQILIIQKKKNPGLGKMLAFLISSSKCLQWRHRTERHLTLTEKSRELAAENTVYPLGSVCGGGHSSLEWIPDCHPYL